MTGLDPPEFNHDCPDWQTLLDYSAGRLPDPARRDVDTHVSACTLCEAVVGELREEQDLWPGLAARVAEALRPGLSPAEPPGLARLRAAACARPWGTTVDDPRLTLEPVSDAAAPRAGRTDFTVGSGFRVGPYEVLEELGHGGMGVVYKARHPVIGQVVALKQILLGVAHSPARRDRFRVEATALARLDHRNITRLHAFDETNSGPYFAMEWVDGQTLSQALEAGPLGFREAAGLVRALAETVHYAHTQGVLHRDLKPANVMLVKPGDGRGAAFDPKVMDFGLAKLVDDEAGGFTLSGGVMGTPSYMSPEQAAGRSTEIDRRTDVYSLGAILYQCLTGRPPFSGTDKLEIIRRVCEFDLVPPAGRRPGVPRVLEAVCVMALARDRDRRYATAAELAADLGNWLDNRPTKARPLTRLQRLYGATRRRAKPLAAGLAAACLLGLSAAALRPPTPVPLPAELTDAERKQQSLAAAHRTLDRGEAAELISAAGVPGYYEWVIRNDGCRVARQDDGTFGIATGPHTSLLELLPDPRTDRFTLTCRLRHDDGGVSSRVGVYVTREGFAHSPRDFHLFTQFVCNVAGKEVVYVTGPGKAEVLKNRPTPPDTAPVELRPRVYMEEGTSHPVMGIYPGAAGRRTRLLGPRNDTWFDVEVTVEPTGVRAVLRGDVLDAGVARTEIDLPAGKLLKSLEKGYPYLRSDPRLQGDLVVQTLRPSFTPRGGLGIVVQDGAVSVRQVVVKPLPVRE